MASDSSSNQLIGRWTTTCVLYFCYFAYAVTYGIWGPTLPQLTSLLQSKYMFMSWGLSLQSAGFGIGALISGFLFDKLNRQLLTVIYLLLMAAAVVFIPLLRSFTWFIILSGVYGLSVGGVDTSCNAWLFEMWKSDNEPVIQGLYFTFALGPIVASAMVLLFSTSHWNWDDDEFTSDDEIDANIQTIKSVRAYFFKSNQNNLTELSEKQDIHQDNNITMPFIITGGLLFTAAFLLLTIFCLDRYKPPKTMKDQEEPTIIEANSNQLPQQPENSSKFSFANRSFIIVCLGCLLYSLYENSESLFFNYIATYSIESHPKSINQNTSSLVFLVMSISFTMIRCLAALIIFLSSGRVKSKYFLYVSPFLIAIAISMLYFVDHHSSSSVTVLIAAGLIGAGFSTVTPSMWSYLEERIHLTNVIFGWFHFLCCAFTIGNTLLVGRFIKCNPNILIYISAFSIILILITFVAIELFTGIKHRNDDAAEQTTIPINESQCHC